MASFLNLNLDNKFPKGLLLKHILFCTFWLTGILILIFRVDAVIVESYGKSMNWLRTIIPTAYFVLLIFYFFFLKWYYIIAFVFYPFLMVFWFIPKTVLSLGKVYLLGSYISSIISRLLNWKMFIAHTILFVVSTIFLITIGANWTRYFSIIILSIFYIGYLLRFLRKAFRRPALFDTEMEDKLKGLIENNKVENSLIIKSYIIQKTDEKLQQDERKAKQIRRTLLAISALNLACHKLRGHRGRQAYLISWIFGAASFLFISVFFFWFINFQLYKIDGSNFIYAGKFPSFDFLYYTLKTITFGDIELVKPISVIARINEIASFFVMGIFILVIVVSIFLSIKQEKLNEDVKLTTEMFENENLTLTKYMQDEHGMEIATAMKDIKNIDESVKNLKNFFDRIF